MLKFFPSAACHKSYFTKLLYLYQRKLLELWRSWMQISAHGDSFCLRRINQGCHTSSCKTFNIFKRFEAALFIACIRENKLLNCCISKNSFSCCKVRQRWAPNASQLGQKKPPLDIRLRCCCLNLWHIFPVTYTCVQIARYWVEFAHGGWWKHSSVPLNQQ